jgi:hypothetical protein
MTPPAHADLVRKLITRTLLLLAFIGLLLFLAAGRLNWPAAWVYLGLVAAISLAGGLWLARDDPGLLEERLRPMLQRDQKPWDKWFIIGFFYLPPGSGSWASTLAAIAGPSFRSFSR